MIHKSDIKLVRHLKNKPFRKETQLFVVEGSKSIVEFINTNHRIKHIYCAPRISLSFLELLFKKNITHTPVSTGELAQLSHLQSIPDALAIVHMPEPNDAYIPAQGYTLLLDTVQDPGNLGTIIRCADWFGWKNILCSPNTVDCYNAKVIQASMGSLARVNLYYQRLEEALEKAQIPVYGAMLSGTPIHETVFAANGLLVLGNEGNGISPSIQKLINYPITIPKYGDAESLNVASAAAIICNEIQRQQADV